MKALFLILFSSTILAATTNFNLEFSIEDLDTGKAVDDVSCYVRQTLTWESQANYFSCATSNGDKFSFKNIHTNVGYIHDARLPYSIYQFGGKNGLINSIAKVVKIDGYVRSRLGLKIYYKDNYLYSSSPEYIIDADKKTYLLKVNNLYY